MAALLVAQITDPFRIALAAALIVTMIRTRADTGTWLPLAFGIAFISVLIPLSFGAGPAGLVTEVLAGLLSTSIIAAVVLGLRALVLRAMGR